MDIRNLFIVQITRKKDRKKNFKNPWRWIAPCFLFKIIFTYLWKNWRFQANIFLSGTPTVGFLKNDKSKIALISLEQKIDKKSNFALISFSLLQNKMIGIPLQVKIQELQNLHYLAFFTLFIFRRLKKWFLFFCTYLSKEFQRNIYLQGLPYNVW